jgi:THO complex subunit 2
VSVSYLTRLLSTRERSERELPYCRSTTLLFLRYFSNCWRVSYKQNKFNLLREQSEGYSKLTTELTSSLGPAHSPSTGRTTESHSLIEERARAIWEKVISLIGYFDLDPNRALDIILDVMSVHLATHFNFFLALLSCSPWSEQHKKSTENDPPAWNRRPGMYKGKSLDEVLLLAEREYGGDTCSTSSTNNPRVLAQVLGFKFGYYQVSYIMFYHISRSRNMQSTDVLEVTPRHLYLTAAILIREGFLTLEDLYPHVRSS